MIEHHDQKGYLRFAINLGNPVLTTLLPDGSPGGITVELAKKLAAESQREARFVTWPTAGQVVDCLLYTSPSPRDGLLSRMPSSA